MRIAVNADCSECGLQSVAKMGVQSSLSSARSFLVVLAVLTLVKFAAIRAGPCHFRYLRVVEAAAAINEELDCSKSEEPKMPIEWFSWLAEVGMQKHGRLMVLNNLEEIDIAHFDHDLLRSIGVDSAKDRLLILNQKNNHMRRAKGKPIQRQHSKISVEAQASIIGRVAALHVDAVTMLVWTKKTWPLCSRKLLQDQGYLTPTASLPGAEKVMTDSERTQKGAELLNGAKDMLWAALYGTSDSNVHIDRVERELLVITIPGRKAHVFKFFQAVTEVGALGTWRDPDERCHDADEPNMMLQVEYGESAQEIVGDAIMVAIHVINLLEVNEAVLYARSSNIEQSTLSTQLFFQRHEASSSTVRSYHSAKEKKHPFK